MIETPARPRVGFIGAGRVGKGLALALSRCGYEVAGIAGRSQYGIVEKADLVFLTVPDDAIEAVAVQVKWRAGVSVVHCSGAAELTVLDAAARAGAATGGFHPLQMFADPEVAAAGLRGCAIAVEAQGPLAVILGGMVEALGARLLRVAPGKRAAYHAGAHYAGPFVAALLAEAVGIWGRLGIPPRDALAALLPLARGSIEAISHSGLERAMAGSVARGDVQTIGRHVDALSEIGPEVRELYCTLALRTVPLALAAGSIDAARAAEIRLRLSAPGARPHG